MLEVTIQIVWIYSVLKMDKSGFSRTRVKLMEHIFSFKQTQIKLITELKITIKITLNWIIKNDC